jgi:hypothetical protein
MALPCPHRARSGTANRRLANREIIPEPPMTGAAVDRRVPPRCPRDHCFPMAVERILSAQAAASLSASLNPS